MERRWICHGLLLALSIGALALPAWSRTKTANQAAIDAAAPPTGAATQVTASAPPAVAQTDIEEIQAGDNRLTCPQLQAQIEQMNQVVLHGTAPVGGGTVRTRAVVTNVAVETGKNMAINTVLTHAGSMAMPFAAPLAGFFANRSAQATVQQAQADSTVRVSAQRRHDRLIQIFDRKNC